MLPLQVSDFGLATEADCAQTQRMFPIKWTAPEALKDSVSIESHHYRLLFVLEFHFCKLCFSDFFCFLFLASVLFID